MTSRSSTSVKKQLIQMQLLLTFFVLLACSSAFMLNDLIIFKRFSERSLKSNARILARSLRPALQAGDRAEAEKTLLNLRAESSIVSARVLDRSSNLFATFDLEGNSLPLTNNDFMDSESQFAGGYFIISQPIGEGGDIQGYLILKSNLSVIAREYKNYIWVVALVFGACLALSYGLAFLIQSSISKPIVALARTAKTISQSGNYKLRLQEDQSSHAMEEMQVLTTEFNLMLDEIQEKDEKIKRHNQELEIEVEERSQDLIQASKMSALGVMAGGLAHEINTPLATLTLNADRLDGAIESGVLDIELLKRINDLNKKITDKIARIVRGLKTFSRDGRRDPMAPKSVQELIQETVALCDQRIANGGIDLQLPELPPDLMLDCRAVEIEQVLLNLLHNSHDAILSLEERWIRIECETDSVNLKLMVTDSGHGIPEAARRKIFEPFFTTKEVGKGTGLGLSISIGIIGDHKGTLVYDQHCANTKFIVTIPLKSTDSVPG